MGVSGHQRLPGRIPRFGQRPEDPLRCGLAALFGVVIGAGYFLGYYRRAFLGPVKNSVIADSVDIDGRELLIISLLALLVLILGFLSIGCSRPDTGFQ